MNFLVRIAQAVIVSSVVTLAQYVILRWTTNSISSIPEFKTDDEEKPKKKPRKRTSKKK